MVFSESWHIRSRARECAATGRPFESGETIVTALFAEEKGVGYVRKDYCQEAWGGRDSGEPEPFSVWQTSFVPPGGDKPEPAAKEDPEDVLRRLVEEDADHTENTRYILAVMLERKKQLVETDVRRLPTGILRIYENRRSGEVYIVKDPNVELDRVAELQAEVAELLAPKEPVEAETVAGETPPTTGVEAEETPQAPAAEAEETAPATAENGEDAAGTGDGEPAEAI